MNQSHKLLLQAALLNEEKALKAYEEWKKLNAIEALNYGEVRLFPLLLNNLKQHVMDEKIRGMTKHTLVKNNRLFYQAMPYFKALSAETIPFIALKGLAMNLSIYENFKLRPMEDIDLLIPQNKLPRAIEIIESLGYCPELPLNSSYFAYHHSIGFKNAENHIIDLHGSILDVCCADGNFHPFYQQCHTVEHCNLSIPVPYPTELLFHSLVHGMRWNPTVPIRWAADACAILNKFSIDWKRFLHYTQKYGVVLPVRQGIDFLRDELEQEFPDSIVEFLANAPCSSADKREFRFHREAYNGLIASIRHHWDFYRHLGYKEGFLSFCQKLWGIERLKDMPKEIVKKIKRKTKLTG